MRPSSRKVTGQFWLAAFGLYSAGGGILSLLGWMVNVPRLTDWFDNGLSTQPNTAIASAAVGVSVICLARGYRRVAAALAMLAGLIGLSTMVEHFTGADFGIDTLLTFGHQWGRVATRFPGRMGPPAASSWTIIGAALTIAAVTDTWTSRWRRVVPVLGGLTATISSLSIIGYLYSADTLYAIPSATAIALQTSTFLLASSFGVMLIVPDYGLARFFNDRSSAGAMVRRTVPALILIPVVLGYLRVVGQHAGYYDLEFGSAARTLAEIMLLIVVIWWAAGDVRAQENQRQKAEQQLIAHEELLRTVTEEAAVGLVIFGRDHRYLYVNRAYGEIVGVPAAEIIGKHVAEFSRGEYETRVRPDLARTFAGETVRYEIEMPGRGGQYLSVTLQPQSVDGIVQTVICALVDTTERRRIEIALQLSQRELLEASRRKDEFLMTLAHELRNPLAPMRTAVDMMRQSVPSADPTWARDVIDRQLTLMVRLLDDLLDVGRVAKDKLTLRTSRLEIGDVLRGAMEISQPLADQSQQKIWLSLPAEPIHIEGDRARLEQVVANLLNNACRYSPAGSAIDIAVSRVGAEVVVRVKDQGIGIPPEGLSRIFEMFSQLDRSIERLHGGLGIGLHLVKRLTELHGGSVEARSEGPGRGSEFIVRLPAELTPAMATTSAPHTSRAMPGTAIVRRKILIVDDNVDAAQAMSMLLSLLGHETHMAHHGRAALDAVASVCPDVVLLDLGLPEMSGFEVCRRIRAMSISAQPIVIAITGWGQDEDRRQSREAGFDEHFVKPVDYDVLAELLANLPKASQRI